MLRFFVFVVFLFLFRVLISTVAELGSGDEFQIYLIGLKTFTSGEWPYFGPDVVYSSTQIPGALQGLLLAIPYYLVEIPEAPSLFLGLLTFFSIGFFTYYIQERNSNLSIYAIGLIISTLPWSIYGTKIINPAYALIFSFPFFTAVIDNLTIYKHRILNVNLSFFLIGFCTTTIMQLHLSWVLLLPFTGIVFLLYFKNGIKETILRGLVYLGGLFLGASTLIPTYLMSQQENVVGSNLVFNIENWINLPTILIRFLAFGSYEIPYFIGSNTEERLAVIKDQLWNTPFVVYLLVFGFAQIGVFAFYLVRKENSSEVKKLKILLIGTVILLYFSFFFSIKGPSSHTFAMLMPIPIYFSFVVYSWLQEKYKFTNRLLVITGAIGILFHIGVGMYNYKHKSIYTYHEKVTKALEKGNHRILGKRRYEK